MSAPCLPGTASNATGPTTRCARPSFVSMCVTRPLPKPARACVPSSPPTPEEADAFVKDPSPEAYEKLVDRLLASPHYGERWARRWLDLARYADTNGYEKDRPRSMWPYRDWVIRSINADMPIDQFTIE